MRKQDRVICIKVGGKAAADESAMSALVSDIAAMSTAAGFLVVHGGGVEVTRLSERLGYAPVFSDGIRMTSAEEMEVVDMVLAGKMNKNLVRRFFAAGIRSTGLSGSDGALFVGRRLNEHTHTGRIERVDPTLIRLLLEHSYLPIIASSSVTDEGLPLNINADEAAFAVAAALPADVLLFLSDIPGVLTRAGERLPELDEETVAQNIDDGTITGGMIPKVNASLDALRAGVGTIVVGRYSSPGDLKSLLDGDIGTRIVLASARTVHPRNR